MPAEPESRAALFERIIAAGDRRRRRLLLTPVVTLAAATLLVSTLTGGDARQLVTAEDSSSSTTPAAEESTTTTTEALATTTTEPEPASTTTESPPVCRNSHDPRCGPFYWDYDPATWPNALLELSATLSPEPVVAGEPVSFEIRFHDPDHSWADNCARASFPGSASVGVEDEEFDEAGNGQGYFPCVVADCPEETRHGPWTPPPPSPGEPRFQTVTRIYDQPGDYVVTIEAQTREACGFRGYDSQAKLAVDVRVEPAVLP